MWTIRTPVLGLVPGGGESRTRHVRDDMSEESEHPTLSPAEWLDVVSAAYSLEIQRHELELKRLRADSGKVADHPAGDYVIRIRRAAWSE